MAETSQMVRSYLKNLGYKDEDVTYTAGANGQAGTVNLQGKNFMQGTPGKDGYIRANQSSLDSSMNQFKGNQATSNTNDLLEQYRKNITTPTQPFAYDVNAIKNDPAYQAQVNSFTQDTNRGTNQALVNLGRRGIGNSQSGVVAEAAGQQNINNFSNNDLLPRMIAEAYSKYVDQNNQQNTQNTNILGLAGVYDEQEQQSYDRGRTSLDDTRYNQEVEAIAKEAEAKSKADQEKAVYDNLWKAAEQTGTLPNELADSYGLPRGTKTLDAAKVGISQQNANTSSRNAGTSAYNASTSRTNSNNSASNTKIDNLMASFKATGIAPAGLESIGIKQGDRLPEGSSGSAGPTGDYVTNPVFIGAYADANSGGLTVAELMKDGKDFISELGKKAYDDLLSSARAYEKGVGQESGY